MTITNVSPGAGRGAAGRRGLTYDDESFDLAVISAGLHHCASPHRALLELYRVAGKGVLALEARDSAFMRAALRLGVVDEYELTAVADNDFASGGVRNSPVPNYVYRWTEREVREDDPVGASRAAARVRVVPRAGAAGVGARALGQGRAGSSPPAPLRLVTRVFPKQANLFAFAVFRGELQPWMRDSATVDRDEVRRRLGH